MSRNSNISSNIDWVSVLLYLLLVFIGWLNIYAAVYNPEFSEIFSLDQNHGKQLLWIGTSLLLITIILIIDFKFYVTFAYLFYGFAIILLLVVLAFGTEVNGAKAWLQFGGISIQAAEFVKFSTALALAKYLSGLNVSFEKRKTYIYSFSLLFLPVAIILLQKDTGSAMVLFSLVIVMYRQGLSQLLVIAGGLAVIFFLLAMLINEYIIIAVVFAILIAGYFLFKELKKHTFVVIAIFAVISLYILSVNFAFNKVLQPHQQTRIKVILGLEDDPRGVGYNLNQSKIAIGSGKFSGKGFLNGTQTKFDFVPEQSTDFIFCTIGEEWGFIGSFVIIALFITLLIRLIILSERQRSKFNRLYGYGVVSILFFHFAVNIAMTIGLFPVVGIPLPFISYGGSSLWGFTILLFIFLKLDASRMESL